MKDIKEGVINTIVALKLDRISRSIYDWENIMTTLEKYNADLVCVNDEVNTTNANGKMISRIMMSVSQNEIERTSEYMPPEKVIQHLDRLRKFYDVYYYEAAYDTIDLVFYFDYVNLNKAIVREFPVEDYKKIDSENKRRVHKLGIIYVIRDDGTLLKEEDDVFNYIPSKNDEKLIPVNTYSIKKESENE